MSVVEVAGSLDDWAIERLETEITLVAAHLAAGECRWSQLVAEFDRREAWAPWGCASAAHWLNFRCGLDIGAARERVRVARRLGGLPLVTAAFSVGELSYSKVRAVTRVATTANEELLVDLAGCMTASQVERVVRCYRAANDAADKAEAGPPDPAQLYEDRFLSAQWCDDGSLEIRAKLPPVEGEMVMAALRRASDALYRDRHVAAPKARSADAVSAETPGDSDSDSDSDSDGPDMGCPAVAVSAEKPGRDVSAETCEDESPRPADGWGARQADALVALAETVVADGLRPGSGPNRHTVVIHTALSDNNQTTTEGNIDDGPVIASETVRRLMCDASLTFVLEGENGTVTNVSRKAPSVPAALARAVKLRDHGCVFPGCVRQAFVDLHHIVHRADGGENTLANCAVLCRAHHRMVHEDGYTMTAPEPGRFEFHRPDGIMIGVPRLTITPGDTWLRDLNHEHDVHPTQDSPVPNWDGTRPDYPYIIDILLYADGRLNDHRPSDN